MRKLLILLFLSCCSAGPAAAQRFGVKTNALHWATAGTLNAGLEAGLGKRTSLELTGDYNPWTLDRDENRKLKFWSVMPEFRYWLCERFNGHLFGLHSGYGEYNISGVRIPFQNKSTQEHRYEGWATGIGISYGYTWILGKRWNLEANIGAGYIYTKYDKYECKTCGRFKGNQKKHYFGPTKAGISLIYIIK